MESKRLVNDEGRKVVRTRLLFESFINTTPTILGFIIWIFMMFAGLDWIRTEFIGQDIFPLIVIAWIIIVGLPITRMIPTLSLIYQEVYEE